MENQDISISRLLKSFLRNIKTVVICCVAALAIGVVAFAVFALSPVAPPPVEPETTSSEVSSVVSSAVSSVAPVLTTAQKVAAMTHSQATAFLDKETSTTMVSLESAEAKLAELEGIKLDPEVPEAEGEEVEEIVYTARTVQYLMTPSEAVASLTQEEQPLVQYLYKKLLFDGNLRAEYLAENGIESAAFFDWYTTIEISNWIITVTTSDIGPNAAAYSTATAQLITNARNTVADAFGDDFLSEIYVTEFEKTPQSFIKLRTQAEKEFKKLTAYIAELEAARSAVPAESVSTPASSVATSSVATSSVPETSTPETSEPAPKERNGFSFEGLIKYVAIAIILGICVSTGIVYVRFTRSKILLGAEQLGDGHNILATDTDEAALTDAASVGVLAIIGKDDITQKSIGVVYNGVDDEYAVKFSQKLETSVGCNVKPVANCFGTAENLKALMGCDKFVALFEEGKTDSDFVRRIAQLADTNPGMYLGCAVVKAPVTEKK